MNAEAKREEKRKGKERKKKEEEKKGRESAWIAEKGLPPPEGAHAKWREATRRTEVSDRVMIKM
ncbi:hypothetical protein KIN20_008651 [Parelaphostrongylus tenuis]|uniref:Uncharacterized protein n=1 Tax=Parelaphostrongylus tenuis TaxID=148309 RepID=A0AAD5MQP6_PARTN|nr:hypothetical protein KIN20_008651 [Parelaphostrongylus tenuis]